MKTIRTGKVGKLDLRLVEKDGTFIGLISGLDGSRKAKVEGNNAEDVWRRLNDEVGRTDPKYYGFDGARARFLRFFPNGFRSDGFDNEERDYKVSAKSKLDLAVPVAEATNGTGFGESVLSVFRATNLLSPFEKTRLQDVLRGPAADPFIRAAARFAMGDRLALNDMDRALKPHDSAKWTVATYLPFLWRPELHMFLKPEVTKEFSLRVGHRFSSDYKPGLNLDVYDSLLDMTAKTASELADLQPRDRIDVQSFIWVVGSYKEDTETPKP